MAIKRITIQAHEFQVGDVFYADSDVLGEFVVERDVEVTELTLTRDELEHALRHTREARDEVDTWPQEARILFDFITEQREEES